MTRLLREDDSRVPFREISRWLVPFALVVLGVALFFTLAPETRQIAAPIQIDLGSP